MIGYIKGEVIYINDDHILLENNGIGYRVFFSKPEKLKLKDTIAVFTYLQVRDDGLSLYGFLTKDEYDLFMKLISVKGLGPKIASNILRKASVNDITNAIENGDSNFIKKLPGIGNKTASQIILDLKGKLVETTNNKVDDRFNDVILALKNFGFKTTEINPVLKKIGKKDESDEVILRKALNLLNKKGN